MANGEVQQKTGQGKERLGGGGGGGGGGGAGKGQYQFQMPVHYPRYSETDYENMPEWQLDRLLSQYGLPLSGSLPDKRSFAIGTFLWSH